MGWWVYEFLTFFFGGGGKGIWGVAKIHTRGWGWWGGGGTSYNTSKVFDKLDHKNAIKHINKGPLPRFFQNLKFPPKTNLKMSVHLWVVVKFSWGGYTFSGFILFFIYKFCENFGERVHFINLECIFYYVQALFMKTTSSKLSHYFN
jgi:hypothetical protein